MTIRLDNACRQCGEAADRITDGLCWMCAPAAIDGPAYDVLAEYRGLPGGLNGPSSNTGLNASVVKRQSTKPKPGRTQPRPVRIGEGNGALVDFLSVTIPNAEALVEEVGEEDFGLKLAAMLFGRHCSLIIGDFTGHGFQGYVNSAPVIAETGEIVGKVGVGGNNDTVHLSISGSGCQWVNDWQRVANGLATMAAKITRCDLAFDDYLGQYVSPRDLDARVERGDLIVRAPGPGKPPKTRFINDHGHGTGCSFYAGKKGRKELCVYEKGKEQGDPDSPWIRLEVRFFNKHAELPFSMLTHPLAYLRGAYNVCESLPADVTERVRTQKVKAAATAVAWARWLSTQVGPSFHLGFRVFGDRFQEFITNALARDAVPGRFRGFDTAQLPQFIREGLGHVDRCDPVGALA